jgi:hypothetical protein
MSVDGTSGVARSIAACCLNWMYQSNHRSEGKLTRRPSTPSREIVIADELRDAAWREIQPGSDLLT